MLLPKLTETKQTRDSITQFNGLCMTNECSQNEFRAMHNMSLKDFPNISVRQQRLYSSLYFTNIKGILGGETLYIASTNKITIIPQSGVVKTITTTLTNTEKTLVKMGKYVCIFPDNLVLVDDDHIEVMATSFTSTSVTFSLTNAKGEVITYHDAAYYEEHDPEEGDYLLEDIDGKSELKQYSAMSGTWVAVTTAYVMAAALNVGADLLPYDGVKISLNLGQNTWDEVTKILPNVENNVYYATYPIKDVTPNAITFSGLITATKTLTNVTFKVERQVPDIKYVTEAMNRLWACNASNEIYATGLGDPFNWNRFEGISTDSWAVTVGSDGDFTGAITYLGYPTFFKENSLIKIAISANGAHQTKETICRGVQKGSSKSLCVVNEILYYKAQTSMVAYDGSLPQSISAKLGDLSDFKNCICGRHKENLYVLGTQNSKRHIFVYDTLKRMWAEEDDANFTALVTWNNVLTGVENAALQFFDTVNLSLVREIYKLIDWMCETDNYDYYTPDSKYLHRITVKMTMTAGASAEVWISYNDGTYERLFAMHSIGTKVYPLTIIPRRCDRYKLLIKGKGNATIHQITRSFEIGSDVY